jgi:DNA polymerase-3 subunit delta'
MKAGRAAAPADVPPEPDRLADFPHPRHQDHLFGHAAATADLSSAARAGRLHHGLLVTGPQGVGKATLAWRLVKAMLSQAPQSLPPDLALGADAAALRQIAALTHPDVLLLRRPWDEKAKRLRQDLTVDEVRRLAGFFSQHSGRGSWRIAVVDAADDLNVNAQNALLKILEEPPDRALLILIAHAPNLLLPTIRSRCRTLKLVPLEPASLDRALDALDPGMDAEARPIYAALSEGAPGRALALSAGGALGLFRETVAILGTIGRPDLGLVSALADRLSRPQASREFDLYQDVSQQILRWMILAKAGRPERLASLGPVAAGLQRACGQGGLERWVALWEKRAAAVRRADALNLDKRHRIVSQALDAEAALRG